MPLVAFAPVQLKVTGYSADAKASPACEDNGANVNARAANAVLIILFMVAYTELDEASGINCDANKQAGAWIWNSRSPTRARLLVPTNQRTVQLRSVNSGRQISSARIRPRLLAAFHPARLNRDGRGLVPVFLPLDVEAAAACFPLLCLDDSARVQD